MPEMDIIRAEIRHAIKKIKNNKAIPAEFLKVDLETTTFYLERNDGIF